MDQINGFNNSNNYNKNKILIILIITVLLIIIVGIVIYFSTKVGSNNDVNSLDDEILSENNSIHHVDDDIKDLNIKYIVFNDKKIYLYEKFVDFVYQFKGLGCQYLIPNVNIRENIDDFDKEYFEKLLVPDYENEYDPFWLENKEFNILCTSSLEHGDQDTQFKIYFDKNDEDSQNIFYKDRKIDKYKIDSVYESTSVVFENTIINLSILAKDKHTYLELYNNIGQYNDWELVSDYESKITYYSKDYNLSFYTFENDENKFINSSDIYFHGLDIIFK